MTRTRIKLAAVAAAWLAIAAPVPALAQDGPPGVAWESLSQQQQQVLERFRDGWEQMPPGRQQAMKQGSERWLSMTPEQQAQARERWQKWHSMPPDDKNRVRQRWQQLRELTPEQREQLRGAYRRFQSLPPERQQELRERWQSMTPEERQEMRDRWRDMSPEQRDQMRQRICRAIRCPILLDETDPGGTSFWSSVSFEQHLDEIAAGVLHPEARSDQHGCHPFEILGNNTGCVTGDRTGIMRQEQPGSLRELAGQDGVQWSWNCQGHQACAAAVCRLASQVGGAGIVDRTSHDQRCSKSAFMGF